jgi:UDP-4-amino-4,6-dideoxy-N-acetyl-beta-L-altrosamine transaminase
MIPYGRQDISQEDIDAVSEVLRSDFLTQGPVVPHFERAVAQYTGARHALAVNSATSALHIACLALGLGEGDWLWTSPITFVASANCGLYCGARVDFVDIDETGNIGIAALEAKLACASHDGRLPKVLVAVHLAGQSCDMEAIAALAARYRVRVVEDASHAIGGRFQDAPIGNCRYSDITIFSFHPVKIVTTGEGGMALTNDDALAARMDLLRSHGITRDPSIMTQAPDGPWYYQQIALGFNYRMTDIQAALGASQMTRIDEFVVKRNTLAQRYDRLLADLPLDLPIHIAQSYSARHLYVVRLRLEQIGCSHREVFEGLRQRAIGVNLHYIPVYLQPWYKGMGFNPDDFPQAQAYYARAISLPMFPDLGDSQQDQVVNALAQLLA